MPDKVQAFLDAYADRQKVFDSILLNKLEGFFSDLQWSLDLNPYTNALDPLRYKINFVYYNYGK